MRELAIFVLIASGVCSLSYVASVHSAWEIDDLRQMEARYEAVDRECERIIQRSEELLAERLSKGSQ
jgi:hypothetical protein